MQVDRRTAHAPRTRDLAVQVSGLKQGCVGCADCKGLCHELIEAMLVPDLVLKDK
ncbi:MULTISPECIES: hypothetical protein [Maritimibacter]|jgi:hypothetical protein|uniref:Uncharacterized protein n=1 Tax=Maritimibacter alkaliphilus HTCC2654 TaxID=314271 RepID=A3VE77_9RHOB|nr:MULTISPECIES: hypothetical protein [Maritimibacter]EAQ13215.1 hypothetical protein RB2654_09104 [Rhodobacterales bacterium HTCC2654] [Maritimibacter alkaliphilus HTCC2654]MBL6428591.1 hypothetical protein [Maritimibacter sp.]TYP85361.1 hypothetical protein BD830_101321 [Maritimibacter alkaliphilus HTCC2654]